MDTTELMRGDWVYIEQNPKPRQVDWIRSGEVGLFWGLIVTPPYLKPVPLTPEILEKNGFRATDETDREFVFYDGYNIKVLFDEGCEIYEQDGKTIFTKIPPSIFLVIEFAKKSLQMPIEYVHELQRALRIFKISKDIVL